MEFWGGDFGGREGAAGVRGQGSGADALLGCWLWLPCPAGFLRRVAAATVRRARRLGALALFSELDLGSEEDRILVSWWGGNPWKKSWNSRRRRFGGCWGRLEGLEVGKGQKIVWCDRLLIWVVHAIDTFRT